MPLSPLEYARHILDEADYLVSVSRNLDKQTFLSSETLKLAFVRSIEIIGEASNKITVEWRQRYPSVD
jgi:uncharacterized protein with HEPN domain